MATKRLFTDPMRAKLLAKKGASLVGRRVLTQAYGDWPGGVARVTRMGDDPAAPEIVFFVEMDGWEEGEMGVFDHEYVELLEGEK